MQHSHVADHSSIVAFEAVKERYRKAGRRLRFVNLSSRGQHILKRAGVSSVNA
ncbi:STAS domain-containing protein [Caballeronia sp. KNU42]